MRDVAISSVIFIVIAFLTWAVVIAVGVSLGKVAFKKGSQPRPSMVPFTDHRLPPMKDGNAYIIHIDERSFLVVPGAGVTQIKD